MPKKSKKGKTTNYPVGHPQQQASSGKTTNYPVGHPQHQATGGKTTNYPVGHPQHQATGAEKPVERPAQGAQASKPVQSRPPNAGQPVDRQRSAQGAQASRPQQSRPPSGSSREPCPETKRSEPSQKAIHFPESSKRTSSQTASADTDNESEKPSIEEVPLETSLQDISIAAPESGDESQHSDASGEAERSTTDFSSRMLITTGLPTKQAAGKLGHKIKLISNLFPIKLLPDGDVYHYDIKITNFKRDEASELSASAPDKNVQRYRCLSTKISRKVFEKFLKDDGNFRNSFAVYDGENNMYCPSELKLNFPYEKKVSIDEKKESSDGENVRSKEFRDVFRVRIKPVEKRNAFGTRENNCAIHLSIIQEVFHGKIRDVYDIQEAMMALETIFRHSPALKFTPVGRSFFHPNINGIHPLSGGIEIWFGYHQSLRIGQWNLLTNLNTSATTFYTKQPLIKFVVKCLNISDRDLPYYTSNEGDIVHLGKELNNLKIETNHHKFTLKHCIIGVTTANAHNLTFSVGGRTISVYQHFRERYDIDLKFPHLPCIQVKPKEKNRYFPIEVCDIPEGQHYRKELTSNDQREMIKYTADPPAKKFNNILDVRKKLANYDNDEYLNSYGIKVASTPLNCTGRILQAPNLDYRNRKIQPRDGSWNTKGLKFSVGGEISSWILLSLASSRDCVYRDLEKFADQLVTIGQASGLNLDQPVDIKIIGPEFGRNYEQGVLRKIPRELADIKKRNIKLTVVVIPFKNKTLYRHIKQAAEVECGLMTQCIDHKNVQKCNGSLVSNLCQKINAKMGGINHTLVCGEIPKIMDKPVMIMGADVSHAGVGDKSGVSVAAVVGGLDMRLSRFAVACRLQKNAKLSKKSVEQILGLKDMVKTSLLQFYRHTRQKPEKIIFYRDGVSDGQFSEVKEKEVTAIRDACRDMDKSGGYQPAITFVVVQKRHQVRFRPEDSRDGARPEGNIPPGTVVDTDVVHAVHRDFYLCSHLGLKGTSKPAHYTVLEDDSNFTPDDFQKLTYYTCNIFFRCTKSISVPVPVAYAHLAAYRTRLRLTTLPEDQMRRQGEEKGLMQELLDATHLDDYIKNSMYFV